MKFSKSQKETKKTPEEEYAEQISTLNESELRDLHKDLKIDHYGNSTAALINTAAGVGLLSMRKTTRRYRTECMQIEAIEARMKEEGWTAHPTRYMDAVPIALGVAAGTTHGMSFGLINVEKNAKRTKDYVKKKDMFKTKEVVEDSRDQSETENAVDATETETKEDEGEIKITDDLEDLENLDPMTEHTEVPDAPTEHAVLEHKIPRKPVPTRELMPSKAETSPANEVDVVLESALITSEPSRTPSDPLSPQSPTPSTEHIPAANHKKAKREVLLSQVSLVNKKMRTLTFKKDQDEKATTVSVTEIASDD